MLALYLEMDFYKCDTKKLGIVGFLPEPGIAILTQGLKIKERLCYLSIGFATEPT